jgi:DNA-binding response OmpR family regulator
MGNGYNGDALKKIIYVDDINFHLLSFRERLQNHFEIYPTQTVERMFEILEKIRPDCILLDVNMPDVNGYEAIGKLKADPRYAAIPVIFLTSQHDKKTIVKGMGLGAVDMITKPFTVEGILECIEYHIHAGKKETLKPIILAIDDSPSILQAIESLLGDQYTVYTVPGIAKDTVLKELLRKIIPDLFLLDCNMPALTGFDLIPIIRNDPQHEETPVIFLTSEGTVDNLTVAINLGASDFIAKPIDKAVLRERIAARLSDFIMVRRIRAIIDHK